MSKKLKFEACDTLSEQFVVGERISVYNSECDEWEDAAVRYTDDAAGLVFQIDGEDEDTYIPWNRLLEEGKSLLIQLGVFECGDDGESDEDPSSLIGFGRAPESVAGGVRKSMRTMEADEREGIEAASRERSSKISSIQDVILGKRTAFNSSSYYGIPNMTLTR